MKTIPIIAQLCSTSEYDTDAPYVYLEVDTELLARIEKAAVSYTHLDVYKRQSWNWPERSGWMTLP